MTTSRSFHVLAPLLVFATACQPQSGDTADAEPQDPLAQLEADTGTTWLVRWQPDFHTPAFLEGRTPPLANTPSDAKRAGREFLLKYAALFKLDGPDDQLYAEEAETDELGMTHARFQQKKAGVKVHGAELVAHFDVDGSLLRVNGRAVPVADAPGDPQLSADQARVAAIADARALRPGVDAGAFSSKAPELVVLPLAPDQLKLAWRVEASTEDPAGPIELETFVDAATGDILAHEDQLDTAVDATGTGVFGDTKKLDVVEKRGTYWLEDDARGSLKTYSARGKAKPPGSEVHSKDPSSWDTEGPAAGAAVDGHVYAGVAYDYFAQAHNRAGWTGKGVGPHVVVHYGDAYANAFFDGKELVFGDGDGTTLGPTAGALDVVAHEFTHGITAHTAKLGHAHEGGALNEAVSDIFGCLIAFGGKKWQVGASIYHPNGHAKAMRDLAHPRSSGNPETMAEYQETSEDNGGVHLNSTIASHAAYLMSKSLSPEELGRVWYRALAHYLHSKAGFADAADATTAAARDLKVDDKAVRAAWVAVGVVSE
jgi:bacillolysin/thermolysin